MKYVIIVESIVIVLLIAGIIYMLVKNRHKPQSEPVEEKNNNDNAPQTKTEILYQTPEEMNRFKRELAHSIRMPIAIVAGYGDMIKGGKYDSDQTLKNYIDIITKNISILNTAFQMALAEKLVTPPEEYERIDLLEIANGVVGYSEKYLAKKNIRMQINSNSSQIYIWGSKIDMLRVLYNMIENSGKYMMGGDLITITLEKTDNLVLLVFRDNGNISENLNIQGTGVGHKLIKQIIDNHGGTIEIKNNIGGYGIFVTFPSVG